MITILILGGGLQALSTAYSLKQKKHRVVCIAHEKSLRYFQYIDKYIDTSFTDCSFSPFISKILASECIDVIIPMSDKMARLLSLHKTEIEQSTHAKCAVPTFQTFEQGSDKALLMHFLEENGFHHPKTRDISSNNTDTAASYVGFPALIKPNHSVGARGITLVHNQIELQKKLPAIKKQYGECTLQEYIDSGTRPYYNVMLYRNKDGEIIAHTIIEILRFYPIKGGSSSYCRTIEEPNLLLECSQVLSALNWIGMADFDVLKNDKGEYKIIELNPRVPASLRAADIAGVNFPSIITNDLMDIPQESFTYSTNKYLRFFGLDIMWFLHSPQRFSFRPSWWCSIGRNTYFQDIYASAPSTWFAWLIEGIQKMIARTKSHQL